MRYQSYGYGCDISPQSLHPVYEQTACVLRDSSQVRVACICMRQAVVIDAIPGFQTPRDVSMSNALEEYVTLEPAVALQSKIIASKNTE